MQKHPPRAWVNGRIEELVSIFDRGFTYGHSLFETIACQKQRAFLLDRHLERLQHGCGVLGINADLSKLKKEIDAALEYVEQKAVIRISLTMGEGGRGYQNPDNPVSNRVVSLHRYPSYPNENYEEGIELGVVDIRLAKQMALAGIKHANRLEQVIARSQWQSTWQEGLLLDTDEQVIEATQSNIFIVSNGVLKTPDLSQSGVAGVMRDFILCNAKEVGVASQIVPLSVADIETAEEVFVSNSIIGLWPIKRFNDTTYNDFKISRQLLTLMQDHGAIPNI